MRPPRSFPASPPPSARMYPASLSLGTVQHLFLRPNGDGPHSKETAKRQLPPAVSLTQPSPVQPEMPYRISTHQSSIPTRFTVEW